jgi:hypothetical protein
MRNDEIPKEGGQFRIPGVGRVKTLHHQESWNHEIRNAKILKVGGQFHISRVGGVKSQDSSSQESRSRETRSCEISKILYQRFGYRELEMSRTLLTGIPKLRSAKIRKFVLTPFRRFADREVELSRNLTSRMLKSQNAKCRNAKCENTFLV